MLLPALARLPQPLALIEVGASAGLTLLPDLYGYDYAGQRIEPAEPDAPVLGCRPGGPVPVPAAVPAVAWRAGIDLNPPDVTDPGHLAWLTSLIWPGETGRQERLSAAIAVAARHRPQIVAGDLIEALPRLAAPAPAAATLVIYHTSVLSYAHPAGVPELARCVSCGAPKMCYEPAEFRRTRAGPGSLPSGR